MAVLVTGRCPARARRLIVGPLSRMSFHALTRQHPRLRLLSWHPLVAAVPFGYFVYRVGESGFSVFRTIGLSVVTIWFVLAIVDLATGHRYLDWLYSDDDDVDGGAAAGSPAVPADGAGVTVLPSPTSVGARPAAERRSVPAPQMLHPKCFVMTTPEVVRGAPILAIDYAPEGVAGFGKLGGSEPGEFGGWTFLHVNDGVPGNADLYFFERVSNIDPAVRTIIEEAKPGTYSRESEFAPFDFEPS